MKRCLKCNQTYSDATLNFCLNDGEMLVDIHGDEPPTIIGGQSSSRFDDSPPTVMMNQTRVTNPTGWQPQTPGGPMAQYQAPNTQGQPWQAGQPAQFRPMMMPMSGNQTLPIVSLCLGAASLTIGWCCSTGLLLGPAALITGFIALAQNKKDPNSYGGKGLAIAGIATGGAFLLIYIIFILIYGLAMFFSALPH
ncbi:MAG: DUF4190 domain-containing protein [Acidobacteriota bacterium]